MMELRLYQSEGVKAVWKYFEDGNTGNPVVAMPTGTGKSLVIAGFVRSVFQAYPNQRILVLAHVKELISQNHDKLIKLWPTAPAGIYSSGLKRKELWANVTFGGIGSVRGQALAFGHIDLIVIDEAHTVNPKESTMYRKLIAELLTINPCLKVIGLTATPYRLGQGHIIEEGGIFTDICYDLTTLKEFNKLIADGYLCPLVPKKTKLGLDITGVHKRGGEFIPKELQLAVDKYDVTCAAVREAIEEGGERKSWLVFTAGVEHAIHTAEILNEFGISAVAVHSGNKKYKMSNGERDTNIAKFKAGEVTALVNSDILTTGFDHPPIDLILCLRPTSSPGLWVQMLGRGTRPVYAEGYNLEDHESRLAAIETGGKLNCLVLDFGGNTQRLGPINDPVLPLKKGKKRPGNAPVKLCENITVDNKVCNTWVHASVRLCPNCAGEFMFSTKLLQEAGTTDLIKQDLPITEEFKVDHITYSQHHKKGAPTSMKVGYYCGLTRVFEYVCIGHTGPARQRAVDWWRERGETPVPETVEEAISRSNVLRTSTHIRVWVNKRYPEITAHCLDGSGFGRGLPGATPPPPAKLAAASGIAKFAQIKRLIS